MGTSTACQKSPKDTLSFRTSPQTGVGIPRLNVKTSGFGTKMFENQGGIATTVCALSRNDTVFRQSEEVPIWVPPILSLLQAETF